MTGPSGDPIVDRAIDELRRLPTADDLAVRRIVSAAAGRRESNDTDLPTELVRRRQRWLRPWLAIGLAGAAAAVGFIVRGSWSPELREETAPVAAAAPAASVSPSSGTSIQKIQMAASPASDVAAIPRQFVLRNGTARRVSVVGDFNNWNPGDARMVRSPDGDLWSITIPVAPGRHTYGFMIDDTLFTLDPRAPRTRDPDLGAEASVVIVGRP